MRNRPQSLDELLAETMWVRRVAYGLLRDAHGAEDVAQDVLTAAYYQQPTASGGNIRAWLRTVTRRKVARKQQIERNRAIAEKQAAREEHEESTVTDRIALHTLLAKAIDDLPPLLGEAVMLRYFDDLAPRQIAKRLDVTSEVVRQRVSRGLKLLRHRLDRDADPESPKRGRELWSAAVLETLALPKLAATSAIYPLLLMSLKVKAVLGGVVCAAALLFLWPASGIETTRSSKPEVPSVSEVTPALELATVAAASANREAIESIAEPKQAARTRVLRIRTRSSELPTNVRAVWVDEYGAPHPIEVSEIGDGDLAAVPASERVWIRADAHVPGFVDLTPDRDITDFILEPGLDVPGILIEDGGVPRARTALKVRWFGPFKEELDADGVPEDLRYELGFSYQFRSLHPDSQGRFTVPAIPAGMELRFSLSSSHIFELDASDEAYRCTRLARAGETIELRTSRILSISARVLRADNSQPAKYCPGYFHFRNQAGERRGALHETCDRDGFFSAGFKPPAWRSMSGVEREAERKRWIYVEWIFAPDDPSLARIQGKQRLDGDEYFIDLGDLHLDPKPVLDAVVYGSDGAPLARAAIRCSNGQFLRSNAMGRVHLPESVQDGHVTVLALGHALRHFASAELAPRDDGVIALRLQAGIELHVSIAEETRQALVSTQNPVEDCRVTVSWATTPFLRSPQTSHPFDFQLHGELWDLNEGLGGFNSDNSPGNCTSSIPESGVVRLFSLRPDAPIQVRLRGEDGSILTSVDLHTPKEPGLHECQLALPATGLPHPYDSFRILGRILDESSVPVQGASLSYKLGGVRGYLDSDAGGRFESGPLPQDDWPTESPFVIYVSAEGHVDLRHEWSLHDAAELSQLSFVMPRSRRIEIRAVDIEGNSVPIESVTLEGHPAIDFDGRSTSAGVWVSEGAPLFDLQLVVQHGGNSYPLALRADEVAGLIEVPAEGR